MSSSKETKAPPETTSEDWALLPWHKLERHAYQLQKRIYRASLRGKVQAVRRLQQLLMRSRSAQLLAVRRVTQDNQGKKTAGIDGKASLTPVERLDLAKELHPKQQRRPIFTGRKNQVPATPRRWKSRQILIGERFAALVSMAR